MVFYHCLDMCSLTLQSLLTLVGVIYRLAATIRADLESDLCNIVREVGVDTIAVEIYGVGCIEGGRGIYLGAAILLEEECD